MRVLQKVSFIDLGGKGVGGKKAGGKVNEILNSLAGARTLTYTLLIGSIRAQFPSAARVECFLEVIDNGCCGQEALILE